MASLRYVLSISLVLLSFLSPSTIAVPLKRNPYVYEQNTVTGDVVFSLGDNSYVANTRYPKATFTGDYTTGLNYGSSFPVAVVRINGSDSDTQGVVAEYVSMDDVLTEDFTGKLIVCSDSSTTLMLEAASNMTILGGTTTMPPGPYLATISESGISLASVYLLYEDIFRTFLFGAYETNDGTGAYTAYSGDSVKLFSNPFIPIPSRLYSLGDTRPLAGERVAIKDLYDLKGLQTSGGSHAWALITPVAEQTAPAIQRIIELGGVIVGKQKLAQFASGANPWEFQDEHYPFNPRGDQWLTCSASSSGGGCSIASYDWLDYAIGSDTGSSMRRPAAVSGTYGGRPSQGMISLEHVLPLGAATDTAGVFSRSPYEWAHFNKVWYAPELHQPEDITGLSTPLNVSDTDGFPTEILYATEYLPLNNSAAEAVLQTFIGNMVSLFNMTVVKQNFTATVKNLTDPVLRNFTVLDNATSVTNLKTQWDIVGKPLTTYWRQNYNDRFPPIDPARRAPWASGSWGIYSRQDEIDALVIKDKANIWWDTEFQPQTETSCSKSVMLYDIGTGGYPSYRELLLNGPQNTSFLAVRQPGAAISGASICPIYGCADYTIPIGQVPYWSNVTYHTEYVPVTVSMIVRRGCDFVLMNMIEKLADAGYLKEVKTGRTAFETESTEAAYASPKRRDDSSHMEAAMHGRSLWGPGEIDHNMW